MQAVLYKFFDDLRGSWRFRTAALATAWAICVIGWTVVLTIPNVFEASARVYLDTQGALRPLLRGLAVESDIQSELNVVRQAMLSGPQLRAIARDAGISTAGKSAQDQEAALDSFKSRIKVSKDSDSSNSDGVYRIAYQSNDRNQTLSVVKMLLDTFVEGTLGSKRTGQDDAQRFLRDQIADYEKRLSESEDRLANFKKNNVGKMPTDNNDYFARLQAEMKGLSDTRSALELAVARYNEMNSQLSGEEPFLFGFDSESNQPQAAVGGDVAMRIQEMEKRREELLLRFTAKHPEVIALDRTLADLRTRQEAELSRVRAGNKATGDLASSLKANPIYQSIQISAKQAAVQVAELRRDLSMRQARVADLQRMVNSVPEVEAELSRLNRDYEVTRAQYQELIKRLETAKLSDEADKTGTVKFKVIEPPSVPETPISPRRGLLLAAVLVVGLAAGCAMAYVLNLWRPVFFGWRSLAHAIGAPVIGCIQFFEHAGESAGDRWKLVTLCAGAGGLVLTFLAVLVWSDAAVRLISGLT